MEHLVERLRGRAQFCKDEGGVKSADLMYEAADEIELLRNAVDHLRNLLAKVEWQIDGARLPSGAFPTQIKP